MLICFLCLPPCLARACACVSVRARACVYVMVCVDRSSYKSIVASIAGLLKTQMHSVNTTLQSVPDYSVSLASEPCAHYPTSCRSSPRPPSPPSPPPPPPPNPDHRKPICNSRYVTCARVCMCHVSRCLSFPQPKPYTSLRYSAWYVDANPFIKQGLRPPFSKPVPTPGDLPAIWNHCKISIIVDRVIP